MSGVWILQLLGTYNFQAKKREEEKHGDWNGGVTERQVMTGTARPVPFPQPDLAQVSAEHAAHLEEISRHSTVPPAVFHEPRTQDSVNDKTKKVRQIVISKVHKVLCECVSVHRKSHEPLVHQCAVIACHF